MKSVLIPEWLRTYDKRWVKRDIFAGLTIGTLMLPQGIAYAMLVGLPPIHGLFAACIPPLAYVWFGTCSQMIPGTTALVAIITGALMVNLGLVPESTALITYSALLCFLVAISFFLMRLLKLGGLAKLFTVPVVAGFSAGAAIRIISSQLGYIFDCPIERGLPLIEIWRSLFEAIPNINFYTLGIGVVGLLIIKGTPKLSRFLPGTLLALILGTIVVGLFGWEKYGVDVVGQLPGGLPSVTFSGVEWLGILKMIPSALIIGGICFVQTISICKIMESRHGYRTNTNKELIALGFMNILSGLMGAFPSSGGFSKSMVNDEAGAKTQLSLGIACVLVLFVIAFIRDWFYFLPKSILATVIIVAIAKLIRPDIFSGMWKEGWANFSIFLFAFFGVLIFGIEAGILIGILVSLFVKYVLKKEVLQD